MGPGPWEGVGWGGGRRLGKKWGHRKGMGGRGRGEGSGEGGGGGRTSYASTACPLNLHRANRPASTQWREWEHGKGLEGRWEPGGCHIGHKPGGGGGTPVMVGMLWLSF